MLATRGHTLLTARRPQHGDVTKIPTPPLQAGAVFINFFFPAIALLVVGLRVYSRVVIRQLGFDDYLIFVAMLCALLMSGPMYMYIKLNYWGWHAVDVPPFDPSPGMWWFYLAQLFYNPVLALVKASVLLFLLRLGGHKQGIRWAIHGINIFNALQAIAIFLVALLQCLPIEANWDAEVKATATCVSPSFHVSISCLTILTDIAVLLLPFWIFLGLKMPVAAKVAVIGVFVLGLSVTIIAVVRLVSVYKLFFAAPDPSADPYYDIGVTLNVVEVNLAIVSASGPALRPLFRRWFPALFGGSSGGGAYGSGAQKYGSNLGYGKGTQRSGIHHRDNTNNLHNSNGGGGGGGGIALKSMNPRLSRAQHTEIRSVSPTGSEEEIMTYNGIMRTTDVHIKYDCDTDAGTDGGFDKSTTRSSRDFKGDNAL